MPLLQCADQRGIEAHVEMMPRDLPLLIDFETPGIGLVDARDRPRDIVGKVMSDAATAALPLAPAARHVNTDAAIVRVKD